MTVVENYEHCVTLTEYFFSVNERILYCRGKQSPEKPV